MDNSAVNKAKKAVGRRGIRVYQRGQVGFCAEPFSGQGERLRGAPERGVNSVLRLAAASGSAGL